MSKPISLSKVAVALSLAYASQFSFAEIEASNTQTQVTRKNGVEIINIATPSAAGISHNQYNKFNVDPSGAVLNNARQNSQTQLAGEVARNPNLRTESARVILNEVVSKNPSKLAGKQEIAGQRADYVLANPNGISVEGGGFINTSRASLVVGKPTVAEGKLKGYQVNGDNALTTQGEITGDADLSLDLIAPKVSVASKLKTSGEVNIVQGRNEVQRDQDGRLTINVLPQKGQVLDGKVAGSIQAGRIRIHSTDDRATINVANAQLKAKEVVIGAGNAKIEGEMVEANQQFNLEGKEGRNVKVRQSRNSTQQQYQQSSIQTEQLVIGVENNLAINGTDLQAKNAVISAGNTHFGTQTTTNSTQSESRKSKGLWHRNESETQRDETVHRTTVSADKLEVVATKGKVTGSAVKIKAENLGVSGKQGVEFNGAKENHFAEATADFRNETARLKTGKSRQESSSQNYIASEIESQNVVLGGEGNVEFAGVRARIDGDLVSKNNGEVRFLSETSSNTYVVNDKQKFWGGIAGSKGVGAMENSLIQHGADLLIQGNALIEADKGVLLSGSRVLSGSNALVKANNGDLVVDAVRRYEVQSQGNRQGTVFDITKARESNFSQNATVQGSSLRSESNLQLTSNQNIDIVGSSVTSAGLLDIAALNNIKVSGAENQHQSGRTSVNLGGSAKIAQPQITFDKDAVIDASLANLEKILRGESKVGDSVKDVAKVAKDSVKLNAEATAVFGVKANKTENQTLTHTAGQLAGHTTNLDANRITVEGSQVSAAEDLNLTADQISTSAQQNQQTQRQRETSVGLTDTVKATESSISNTLTFGVTHNDNRTQTLSAQGSQLVAGKDLALTANNIAHQGSALSAGANLTQTAQTLSQGVANDQVANTAKKVNVSATLTTAIDKSKAINGSFDLNAEGGRENSVSTNAQATRLSANNIAINAERINDLGTQYQANQNAAFISQQHNLAAAYNREQAQQLNAGVSLGVSASTADLKTVDVSLNTGAKLQTNQTASSTAQKAQIQAQNVVLNTQQLNSQADISAQQAVVISAQNANLVQAQNSQTQSAGGFEANVSVGGLVIPTAGAIAPSVAVSAKVNGQKAQATQAVIASIQGTNVAINAEKLNLQGTNVQAQSANLSVASLNLEAGHSQAKNLAVKLGGGAKVGANNTSVSANGNVQISAEESKTHQGTQLNAQNLVINADNVAVSGAIVQADNLTLNSQNLALTAVQDQLNKTSIGTSLALNGGVKEQKWSPNSGSASLNLESKRNQTTVETALNSKNANINVVDSTNLVGATINAEQATGDLGNVSGSSLVNRVKEVNVSLSANSNGKFTAYPSTGWASAAKKDWDNGTIGGLKAEASVEASSTQLQNNALAGVNVQQGNLKQKQGVTNRPVKEKNRKVTVSGKVNTNVQEMAKRAKDDVKNKRLPWVRITTK